MIDWDFALHSLLLAGLRGADLLATYLISGRTLHREMNPFYRLIGWRWVIIINLALVAFAYRWPLFYWICVVVTVLVTFWNVGILIIQPSLRKDMLASLAKQKWKKRVRRMRVKRVFPRVRGLER